MSHGDMVAVGLEVVSAAEIEGRVVYLLEGCQDSRFQRSQAKHLRSGTGLSPLTFETANALLPPFGSHLVDLLDWEEMMSAGRAAKAGLPATSCGK